ncbi:hypothetical protein MNV49_004796 [Pseudohyphozyma bogoriensis]|nr:hypothetical protein MNV49_004796 [Pseudohyphozyma bogoriensis]
MAPTKTVVNKTHWHDQRDASAVAAYTKLWEADPLNETGRAYGEPEGRAKLSTKPWPDTSTTSRTSSASPPLHKVLDVGCGIGGPAREIATFSDASVVGVNNNAFQVERAKRYTKRQGLEGKVSFVKGDFMKLEEEFGRATFDAVYAIEATYHAPDWEDGIPEMRSIAACRQALLNVGFEIEHEEDLASRPDPIKWFTPLEGDLTKVQSLWDVFTCWRMTKFGKTVTQNAVWVLEKCGFVPKGTFSVGEALKTAGTRGLFILPLFMREN